MYAYFFFNFQFLLLLLFVLSLSATTTYIFQKTNFAYKFPFYLFYFRHAFETIENFYFLLISKVITDRKKNSHHFKINTFIASFITRKLGKHCSVLCGIVV